MLLSTIDYYGVTELSYYAIKDSYEPLHACILFSSMRMEEDVKLPVYLLDDADRLDGSAWSVQVRAYDENLHVISEAVYSGRDSANVTYLGHLPVDRADAGSGPVLLTAEVYVEGEKRTILFTGSIISRNRAVCWHFQEQRSPVT